MGRVVDLLRLGEADAVQQEAAEQDRGKGGDRGLVRETESRPALRVQPGAR